MSTYRQFLALLALLRGCLGNRQEFQAADIRTNLCQMRDCAGVLARLLGTIQPANGFWISGIVGSRHAVRSTVSMRSEVPAPKTSRRAALGVTGMLLTPFFSPQAVGYDRPKDFFEVALKKQGETKASAIKKNEEADKLLEKVSAANNDKEYDRAMTDLTLWIIASGPTLSQMIQAGKAAVQGVGLTETALPRGFRTRELIKECMRVKDEKLPRFIQKAGVEIEGLEECSPTRTRDFCKSAGPLAETAFTRMLKELETRAPRQYCQEGCALLVWD